MPNDPLVRDLSDTARWVAAYRALETARPDALFQDPFAERLAGDRGRAVAKCMAQDSWPFTMRTLLIDAQIQHFATAGVDTVVNLAAGMDARPYRMKLPPGVRWFEIDMPEILAEKERLLSTEKPECRLERIALDLADGQARRAVFDKIGASSKRAIVLSEGLLVYLTEAQVATLADDLAATAPFQHWIIDMATPVLLKMIKKSFEAKLKSVGEAMHFAPADGPTFFEAHGWKVSFAQSFLHEAARHRRVNFLMRLIARIPDSQGKISRRPWGGICVLERDSIKNPAR